MVTFFSFPLKRNVKRKYMYKYNEEQSNLKRKGVLWSFTS